METLVSAEQRHQLSAGRVPLRRRRLVRREKLQTRLCQRIKEFAKEPNSRWLLVCGMPGCGKSQLVNDVLWERPELCLALFGRVLWLTDRHLNPAELPAFVADCLALVSLDQSTSCGRQIERFLAGEEEQTDAVVANELQLLGHRLRTALEESMVDTLLVLDGVMTAECVRFFDEFTAPNCKLLATSTSSEIFASVNQQHGLDIFRLSTDELSVAELRQLAECFGMEMAKVSDEWLQKVLAQTGGNLALLEKLLIMARGQRQILDSLLARFSGHRPLAEFSCHSAYRFVSLERPLHICMRMLGAQLSRAFDHCSVLEPLVWTPFEIISLVWPLDVCGTESEAQLRALMAQQLLSVAANSLLDSRECLDVQFDELLFRLQPLVLNFLLHSQPDSHAIFAQSAQAFLLKLRRNPLAGQALAGQCLARNEQRLLALHHLINNLEMDYPDGNAVRRKKANRAVLGWSGFDLNFAQLLRSFWWPSNGK